MNNPDVRPDIGTPRSIYVCPHHSTSLVERHVGKLRVWHCAGCSGLWLPAGAFHASVGHVSVTGRGRPSRLSCPADGQTLTAVSHRGIEVDVCGHCGGVWFDHGELQKILAQSTDPARRFLESDTGSSVMDVAGNAVDLLSGVDVAGELVSAVFDFLGGLFP
jgi:Zn-finger nucleic acid-binding protein